MVIEVMGVFVDVLGIAGAIVGERHRRKGDRRINDLAGTLQKLDQDTLLSDLSSVKLAEFMHGGVTAKTVSHVVSTPSFKGLLNELILCSLADG